MFNWARKLFTPKTKGTTMAAASDFTAQAQQIVTLVAAIQTAMQQKDAQIASQAQTITGLQTQLAAAVTPASLDPALASLQQAGAALAGLTAVPGGTPAAATPAPAA